MIVNMLHIGVPSAASTSADLFSSSATTTLIAGFGMLAAASNQITANLNGIFYVVHTALSMACGILVSQSIGKNDPKGTLALVWFGLKVNILLALCITTGILLFGHNIVQLYTSDVTIQTATIPLVVVMAFYHLFDAQSAIVGELLYCYRSIVLSSAIHIIIFCFGSLLLGWYLATYGWHIAIDIAPMGALGFWIMILFTSFISVTCNSILLYYTIKKQS